MDLSAADGTLTNDPPLPLHERTMTTEELRSPTAEGMGEHGIALFETAIGRCGLAWSERGIAAVGFPDPEPERTLARVRRSVPGATETKPPQRVALAIDAIKALLDGEATELSSIELDFGAAGEFERRVYEAAREIPPGETLTYGELAARIGSPSEAREVGKALARNRVPIIVPCHRVVAADGKLGGFSARGGTKTKLRLLSIESRHGREPMTLFDPGPDPHEEI